MSTLTKNWSEAYKERCKLMFNNDLLSDVKFVVRTSQHGDCSDSKRSKMAIPAHKFLLSVRSPVFFAMFCGKMAEAKELIDLPDCEYEGLFELLRYIYTDEVCLTGGNVMQVAYLAEKYMFPCLVNECVAYLRKNLDSSNAFCVLKHAQQYANEVLHYHCWDFIDTRTDEILKTNEFLAVERSVLEQLLKRDTLTIREVQLFKAVSSWAEKECERQGLNNEGSVKREILGDQVVKNVRFTSMEQREFVDVVLNTNILTEEEAASIMKYFSSLLSHPLYPNLPAGFVIDKRVGSPLRCCRFFTFNIGHLWANEPEFPEIIDFMVDLDIMLQGVSLFGSEGNDYSVTLKILNSNDGSVVASKSGTFRSEVKRTSASNFYFGFDVLFDEVVSISKDAKYRIEASIDGPPSGYGSDGFDEAYCTEVAFTFECAEEFDFEENLGQFAELLYKLREQRN